MTKKKPIEEVEPAILSEHSPAGIILTHLNKEITYEIWEEVKDKYTTDELRDLYNVGVKQYRKNNKERG